MEQSNIRRLVWDIEVSPNVGLFWSPGFKVSINPEAIVHERKIICIGYKWVGEKKTTVIGWDQNMDDRAMLTKFLKVLETADEAIAHFGDSFDMPWLKARCLILGFDPMPLLKTVDTKTIAAKNYYFNSNKLDYLGSVLGFGHKIKTDYSMWKEITLNNCRWNLAKMMTYCGRDVELLEKVWGKLRFTPDAVKSHAGVVAGHDRWSCPHCGSTSVKKSKTRVTPKGIIQHQMHCVGGCKGYYSVSDYVHRQYTESRKRVKPSCHKAR